jgi:hypothetical protein
MQIGRRLQQLLDEDGSVVDLMEGREGRKEGRKKIFHHLMS